MDHISTPASPHSLITIPHLCNQSVTVIIQLGSYVTSVSKQHARIWLQAGISANSAKLLKGQNKGMTAARHQQLSDPRHADIQGFCSGIAQ